MRGCVEYMVNFIKDVYLHIKAKDTNTALDVVDIIKRENNPTNHDERREG